MLRIILGLTSKFASGGLASLIKNKLNLEEVLVDDLPFGN